MKTEKMLIKNSLKGILTVIFILCLAVFIGIGCSGDDDDDTNPPTTTSTNTGDTDTGGTDTGGTSTGSDASVEEAVNASIIALGENSTDGVDDAKDAVSFLGVGRQQDRVDTQFQCGTVSYGAGGATYNFNGACGVTGSISMQTMGGTSFKFTFTNYGTTDCLMNGDITFNTTTEGDVVTTTYTFSNFDKCGKPINGSYTIKTNTTTGEVIYDFGDKEGTVTVGTNTVKYNTDLEVNSSGKYDGSISVDLGEKGSYNIQVNGVQVDPTCCLPTSGTMQVTTNEGTISFDFSNTTCSNPTATYTKDGVTGTVDLTNSKCTATL